jgi:hypothetical protein
MESRAGKAWRLFLAGDAAALALTANIHRDIKRHGIRCFFAVAKKPAATAY